MLYFFGALVIAGAGGFALLQFFRARRPSAARSPAPLTGIAEEVRATVSKVFKGKFDKQIAAIAAEYSIRPVLLKAIVARESSFDPHAINPETPFTLEGVSYTAADRAGRAKLRQFILGGGDPLTLGINPSIGLAQVRVRIARKILRDPGLTAAELFDVNTNLRASAALLAELIRGGVTLETIDAYNVGADLKPRNFPYRDAVMKFVRQFEGDF